MFLRRIFISRKQLTCKEKREEESNFKTIYYYYISHVAETLFERGKLFLYNYSPVHICLPIGMFLDVPRFAKYYF